jgi:membrane protein implicated in regulation of membrane protease activity
VILRAVLLAAALAALVGSIAIGRPERFGITASCAAVTLVVGAGALVGDALPPRRALLACSVATLLLGAALLGRGEVHVPVSAALAVVQVVALALLVRARRRERAPGTPG